MMLDDDDERLWLKRNGHFEAEVVPERDGGSNAPPRAPGSASRRPDDMVEFYDPTDIFGDLAEALAESFPAIVNDGDEDDEEDDDVDDAADAADDAMTTMTTATSRTPRSHDESN